MRKEKEKNNNGVEGDGAIVLSSFRRPSANFPPAETPDYETSE